MEHARLLIYFTILCYFITKIVMYFWNATLEDALIGGGAWYLVFNLIPQSIIHFRFLYLNHGMVLCYREESGNITISKGTKSVTFGLGDIQLIQNCMLPPKYDHRRSVLPFDRYHYYIIYLQNGSQFVITSLMVDDLNLPIDSEKKEAKKVLFAYPTIKNKGNVSNV